MAQFDDGSRESTESKVERLERKVSSLSKDLTSLKLMYVELQETLIKAFSKINKVL